MATTIERSQRKAPVQRVIVYVDGFNLYEAALPLDAINTMSAREESVICVSTDSGI